MDMDLVAQLSVTVYEPLCTVTHTGSYYVEESSDSVAKLGSNHLMDYSSLDHRIKQEMSPFFTSVHSDWVQVQV